jgi:hypothetical protein
VHPVCLAAHTREDSWRWHTHFEHANFTSLKKLATTGMVCGLPQLEQVDQLCEACLVGKHKRASFSIQASRRATRSIEMVRGDLCGLVTPTPRGNKFFLLLVDDYSRYLWISLLSSKDQATAEIRRIHAVAKRKSGNLLGVLRTDR